MKIFVCKNSNDLKIPNFDYYIPIQSGTELSKIKFNDCIHDNDSPDNISNKNNKYAELSVQYFIYKNMQFDDNEIVGLCHQRRYFLDSFEYNNHPFLGNYNLFLKFIDVNIKININKQYFDSFEKNILHNEYNFDFYDFIVGKSSIGLPTLKTKDYWKFYNDSKILDLTRDAINKLYPDYLNVFDYVFNNSDPQIMDNMFITKWINFKNYSKWLFDIYFEIEDKIDFEKSIEISENNYKQRKKLKVYYPKIFPWLSEHLFNVWFLKNRMTKIEKFVIVFN